jgi:hypothetical protein
MCNPSSDFHKYHIVAVNAPFRTAFSVKILSFTPRVRRKAEARFFSDYAVTVESVQFYSAFSPTTISLIRRCHGKCDVLLCFFAQDAQ